MKGKGREGERKGRLEGWRGRGESIDDYKSSEKVGVIEN